MKLLFLIQSLSTGGAERVTSTLANYWAGNGHEVTIVTLSGINRDFYQLDESIKRIALNLKSDSPDTFRALYNNFRRIQVLRRVLREENPDVAIGMMTTANCLLALAGKGLGFRIMGSERSYPPAMPVGRFWSIIRYWSYQFLDVLVAQTGQSAAWLHTHTRAKHITVIANPVSYPLKPAEPLLQPADALKKFSGSHVLLAAGRLNEEKCFDQLIRVFSRLAPHHRDWVLVILGDGPMHDELRELVVQNSLEKQVLLPGAVGNIGQWYEAANLFALTSRFEGFPNTLLEAMAYGTPAVAVDCKTGPSEIIRHEVDGLLVSPQNPMALETALSRLMSDDGLRVQMASQAGQVRHRFNKEKMALLWQEKMTPATNRLSSVKPFTNP